MGAEGRLRQPVRETEESGIYLVHRYIRDRTNDKERRREQCMILKIALLVFEDDAEPLLRHVLRARQLCLRMNMLGESRCMTAG